MGQTLIECVLADKSLELAATLDARGSPAIGRRAGAVKVGWDVPKALKAGDVLIDFTRPDGTIEHLEACARLGKSIVIGTTGIPGSLRKAILQAGRRIPIAMSPNFAIGVNAVFKLAEVAAGILGDEFDVEIIEAHHRHKVDAPSGTALRKGEVVAQALGRDLKRDAVYGREGVTGERKDNTIGFATVRGGDLVGEHSVMFIGTGERLEISHRASSRANFAHGALRAARWVAAKKNGLYDMADVLGFAK